jgi:acetyl-CoA synthetase
MSLPSGMIKDSVPRDAAGAREIGFALPEHYNCSEILWGNLASGQADKVAVLCEERKVTYRQLCDAGARVGNGLKAFGLQRGERVLCVLKDGPEYAAALFGAIRAGFVPVLVNTLSSSELIAYYAADSQAQVAIVSQEHLPLFGHPEMEKARLQHVVVVGEGSRLEPGRVHFHGFAGWAAMQKAELPACDTHRDEMAFWMYSSGSTGRPKGVVHLQHDAPYTHEAYGKRVLGLREHDIVFSPPKIFFAYGFGNSLTFPFSEGATTVLHPGRPDPGAVLGTIERHRPTVLFGLPTLYNALVTHPAFKERDLSSLRLCLSAAEVLSADVYNEWERGTGLRIVEGLGSTEVLHIYLSNRLDKQVLGASGTRVPGYELKLTDADEKAVARGETGILWVRGDSQAPCYWNRPERTAETMRDSWIWTGDRFREDDEGFLHFEGRADDMVKVSGQWVHPTEVERCLASHPAIHECVVMAVEDEKRLVSLKAWVVLKAGHNPDAAITRALQDFVKGNLLPYKYPRSIEYLTEFPKTGTNKVDRQALKRATE